MRRATMLFLVCVCGAALRLQGQDVKGPAGLQAPAVVRKDVAAFPRVVAGGDVTAPVAAKVNASLARLDASVAKAAADCRKDTRQSPQVGKASWTRTVDVTMRGPRFLSVLATDSFFCGGMYPNDGILLPVVYDLSTGAPVNWLKYLPAGTKTDLSNSADGAKVGVVVWPALTTRARKEAEADCKDSFAEDAEVQFVLWLDGRAGRVVAQPYGLAHAVAACANTLEIPVSEARKMGFHGDVLDALETATKMQ